MAGVALCMRHTETGIRPFDPRRDFQAVVELIDMVFRDGLGPSGRATLARMHRMARGGALWWWFAPLWGKAGISPGFVWVDDGEVVGSISMRKAPVRGGYFIGNVVVHPDWRRQGIASALMRAVLKHVRARKGHWVGLEVRSDNQAAGQLYEQLGFQEVGRTLYMVRPAQMPWHNKAPSCSALRRLRGRDGGRLIDLLQANVTVQQRQVLGLRKDEYQPTWARAIDHWFQGKREVWWGIEREGTICGAVRVLRERRQFPNQLEVLVAPACDGRFEDVLVKKAGASLRGAVKKGIEIVLPRPTDPLLTVLEEVGFFRLHELAQMRLSLVHHISVT